MIFLRFKNLVKLRLKCVFFFRLFSRSKCVFSSKIGVSSRRNGGVEKRLSFYREFVTFLTARSENRREITLFLTGFFSSNFEFFSSNLEIFGNFASSWRQKSAQKHVFLRYEHIATCHFCRHGQCFVKIKTKKTAQSV